MARVVSVKEDGGKIRLKQLGLTSIGGRTGARVRDRAWSCASRARCRLSNFYPFLHDKNLTLRIMFIFRPSVHFPSKCPSEAVGWIAQVIPRLPILEYSSKGVKLSLRCVPTHSALLGGRTNGYLEDYGFIGWTRWTIAYLVGLLGCMVENVAYVWRRFYYLEGIDRSQESTGLFWLILTVSESVGLCLKQSGGLFPK